MAGWTPLIWACSNGHVPVIRLLHERGCDVDRADFNGWTGLTWACWNANEPAIEVMLKELRAEPSPCATDGRYRRTDADPHSPSHRL
jgi:ankyrin repeat protein